MIGGAMVPTESYLAYKSKLSHMYHMWDLHPKNHGIELGQGMISHDYMIITLLNGIPTFKDKMDDIGGLRPKKIGINNIIEKIGEEG